MHARRRNAPSGFTLIELLVVVAIIGLVSAIALPTVLPALNEARVSESARVLQAILAGTRDAAIRANAPRGIRLLPDPVFNGLGGNPLASNRVVPIEPGPDYTEGLVNNVNLTFPRTATADPLYAYYQTTTVGTKAYKYLMICESGADPATPTIPNNPTNWSLNVRQGDKIRFNDSGVYYTVAGPINGPPFGPIAGAGVSTNSERAIACYPESKAPLATQPLWAREFLFLTNGIDDNGNGWIDEQCDGIDNDGDGITDPGFNGLDDNGNGQIDEPAELAIGQGASGALSGTEFEQEVFLGSQASSPPSNEAYTIFRRPVVSPGARETTLPSGVVIDLTTWNAASSSAKPTSATAPVLLPERSRLPVDSATGYVDIMIDQTGRVITQGAGMDGGGAYANSPLSSLPFYQFWLTEREGVVAPLFGYQGTTFIPARNPSYGAAGSSANYLLPMPKGTPNYSNGQALIGERRLVTLFVKTGQIVSNSIQNFSGYDTNAPFYDAQAGIKEPQ